MDEQEFAPGHVFFRPGDTDNLAYLLQEGSVELLSGSAEPLTRIGLFMPGDVFGEMALIEERPRAFTMRAVTAGRVLPMSREVFEHHLLHDPVRIRQYLRSLFERLRSLTASRANTAEADAVGTPVPVSPIEEPESPGLSELPVAQGMPGEWTVVIHPLTRKAAQTLPDDGLWMARFPLRIGRAAAPEEEEALDLNDLWLLDNRPYNISRNHCEITVDSVGPYVRDRGSHLGCFVNDVRIGGPAATDAIRLEPGDNVLIVGLRMSPYQFRVTVSPAEQGDSAT